MSTSNAQKSAQKSAASSTHRKRLARALAEKTGRPYAACLEIVRRAADAGRLPEPLDKAGMAKALDVLMSVEPRHQANGAIEVECHAARTGEGYWTCDVPGGCSDCRALAHEIDDVEQTAAWDTERTNSPKDSTERSLYLIPSFLAALRQVWQGRVAKEPYRDGVRFTLDSKPATGNREIEFPLLERDGYIEARLVAGEEWVVARTTVFGDEVLAANRADTDRFRDGLPAGAGLPEAEERNREPYVGSGADGARRSAQIDREEADGLDRTDPRYDEVLSSAERWDRQAERMEERDRQRETFVTAATEQDRDRVLVEWNKPIPVQAALTAVEREPFGTDEGARRKASDPRDQRIWDLSWVYERLTGSQGLVYITAPGKGADRYVFGGHYTALGREDALRHVTGLIEALRLRDDLVWPPRPEDSADQPGVAGSKAVLAALDRKRQREHETLARHETHWRVAHEGSPVPRCTGSSWRSPWSKKKPETRFGPGGYNRCVKAEGHAPADGGRDPHHVDEWGHVFLLDGASFKVLNTISNAEMADVAREAGLHVSDGSDMERVPVFPPSSNTLWVTGGKGARVEMVKVSEVYADEQRITAQVVHPVPPRTTVRSFSYAEARRWREPSDAEAKRYERAWGFDR